MATPSKRQRSKRTATSSTLAVVEGSSTKRYAESSSLAVRSGIEIGQDASMDDLPPRDIDGVLDADLAELSLGQRLTALGGLDNTTGPANSSDSEEETSETKSSKQKKRQDEPGIIPANSLTRTLIQALHSSDSRLLETCLAHSNATLVRNTIRRLPPQLAVPLLNACMERLGRGARSANLNGRGGGASSQRGMGLITWIKAVLATHSGHLMTMPDLVARLAGLHATLTARLTLQESLLSLSGRLEMVLSQIEMRSSNAPTDLNMLKSKQTPQNKRQAKRYVEGESEEDENVDVEVEMDGGDDAEIEDVQLGGDSQDDDGEDEASEDGDEEDDDDGFDGEGPTLNGFIDDEAEESDGDEDDDESE